MRQMVTRVTLILRSHGPYSRGASPLNLGDQTGTNGRQLISFLVNKTLYHGHGSHGGVRHGTHRNELGPIAIRTTGFCRSLLDVLSI